MSDPAPRSSRCRCRHGGTAGLRDASRFSAGRKADSIAQAGDARRIREHGRVAHYPSTPAPNPALLPPARSEEHTSELQSLMRIAYAVFCFKKKNRQEDNILNTTLIITT